jgi:hypothetical protein
MADEGVVIRLSRLEAHMTRRLKIELHSYHIPRYKKVFELDGEKKPRAMSLLLETACCPRRVPLHL